MPDRLPRPAQLPADTPSFTGRGAELRRLLMPAADVLVVSGMAGVGKTALVVHAAHRLARRFPDGQLFVDLHGFTHHVETVAPVDALGRMLRALGHGHAGGGRPDVDHHAALLRSVLAGRRMLIVLDNAAGEAQLAPLLPGAPGCLVLVTSRRRLPGLDDAASIALDVLPVREAVALLAVASGAAPGPLPEIAELCGRLPLAIRIAAARLRTRPAWTAEYLADRLRDRRRRIDELDAGRRSVTATLDVSYRHLPDEQRAGYRLLGLHPGHDLTAGAAAALTGTPTERAARLLDDLVDAHLLTESAGGRYQPHDLVRAHANRTATRHETPQGRDDALTRLLDHYTAAACAAMDVLYPGESDRRPTPPRTGDAPGAGTPGRAAAWLDTELPNLLAAAAAGAARERPDTRLAAVLHRHLCSTCRYTHAESLHTDALSAARAAGDLGGELGALQRLGEVHHMCARYGTAARHFDRALAVAVTVDSRTGTIDALAGLGWSHLLRGRNADAADRFRQALELADAAGDRTGTLHALSGLGNVHRTQGELTRAVEYLGRALTIATELGDRLGTLHVLGGLGAVHSSGGELDAAAGYYRSAIELARETGLRNSELEALHGLGRAYLADDRPDLARRHLDAALALARDLGQPNDEARVLDALGHLYHRLGRDAAARRHWRRAADVLIGLGVARYEEVDVEDIGRRLDAHADTVRECR